VLVLTTLLHSTVGRVDICSQDTFYIPSGGYVDIITPAYGKQEPNVYNPLYYDGDIDCNAQVDVSGCKNSAVLQFMYHTISKEQDNLIVDGVRYTASERRKPIEIDVRQKRFINLRYAGKNYWLRIRFSCDSMIQEPYDNNDMCSKDSFYVGPEGYLELHSPNYPHEIPDHTVCRAHVVTSCDNFLAVKMLDMNVGQWDGELNTYTEWGRRYGYIPAYVNRTDYFYIPALNDQPMTVRMDVATVPKGTTGFQLNMTCVDQVDSYTDICSASEFRLTPSKNLILSSPGYPNQHTGSRSCDVNVVTDCEGVIIKVIRYEVDERDDEIENKITVGEYEFSWTNYSRWFRWLRMKEGEKRFPIRFTPQPQDKSQIFLLDLMCTGPSPWAE
jgi:hypothetical protein